MKAEKHQLSGDWTIEGVVSQVDLLSHSLQEMASYSEKDVYIDCGSIDRIDMSGLQLLHVWIECARIRGVQPQLVNLPESLKKTISRLGIEACFSKAIKGRSELFPNWKRGIEVTHEHGYT